MLISISSAEQIDRRKFMDIYREGNAENAEYFYPDMEKQAAVEKAEDSFMDYLNTDFFGNERNRYYVLELDGTWVCALRLYFIRDGLYYLEALETHPDYRKRGYAVELLRSVFDLLKETGPFQVCDCVSHKNIPSLATHKKSGFEIVSEQGYDYLQNEVNERCYGMRYQYNGQ